MRLVFLIMFTCAYAFSGIRYQSDLHKEMQAAFSFEAERAYRDIIEYDENAPVTREEIYALYRKDAYFAPVRRAISSVRKAVNAFYPYAPEEYCEKCIYEGKILDNAPDGVVFVRAYLLPFSPSQAKKYDEILKSGDKQALDALFSPLEDHLLLCGEELSPENGFEPYFRMEAGDGVIPCAGGVLFLTKEAASCALGVSGQNRISPPVRDARGIMVFEYVSG